MSLHPEATLVAISQSFRRIAWTLVVLFVLLTSVAFVWFANDMLISYESEVNEWNAYRSYGIVRSLGVEFAEELKEDKQKDDALRYEKILKKIIESNSEVVDLALLNSNLEVVAQAGNYKKIINYLLENKKLVLNNDSEDVNYDNNVRLIDSDLKNIPGSKDIDIDYGVMDITPTGRQAFSLVVGFKPLKLDSPRAYIYAVCLAILLAWGLIVWELTCYLLKRLYTEPVAHLHVLAKEFEAGRWPAASVPDPATASSQILQLASACLDRCQKEWEHWQWQLQKVQHAFAQPPASGGLVMQTPTTPRPRLVPTSVVCLYLFMYAGVITFLLLMPTPMPWWGCIALTVGMLGSPLAILPGQWFWVCLGPVLRGGLVGAILAGILWVIFQSISFTLSGSAMLLLYGVCAMVCGWAIRCAFKLRKNHS